MTLPPNDLAWQFCWFLTPWLVFYLPVIIILFVSPVLTIYAGEYVDLVDYEEQRWTRVVTIPALDPDPESYF